MQIVTPLGTQHAIPIWRPIGEREKPVMVQELPKPVPVRKPKQIKYKWSYQRIAAFIRQSGKGCTTKEIIQALGMINALDEILRRHPEVFYAEPKRVSVPVLDKHGRIRNKSLYRWHVHESYSYNEKGKN